MIAEMTAWVSESPLQIFGVHNNQVPVLLKSVNEIHSIKIAIHNVKIFPRATKISQIAFIWNQYCNI